MAPCRRQSVLHLGSRSRGSGSGCDACTHAARCIVGCCAMQGGSMLERPPPLRLSPNLNGFVCWMQEWWWRAGWCTFDKQGVHVIYHPCFPLCHVQALNNSHHICMMALLLHIKHCIMHIPCKGPLPTHLERAMQPASICGVVNNANGGSRALASAPRHHAPWLVQVQWVGCRYHTRPALTDAAAQHVQDAPFA